MSVPVLSWSLIGDRTTTPGNPVKGPQTAAKQWPSTEAREQDRVRPEGLAQAYRWAQLLPAQSPTTPTLRANPYPEVTDPICRFPLPTFFHRLEAVHLGDLMRISVRASASVHLRSPPTRFSRAGLETTTDPAETRGSSGWAFLRPVSATLSPRDGIPGFRSLKQKRKLFPGFRAASLVCVALPRP